MKTHPVTIEKYNGTLKELARDITDLRYDALAEFMKELSQCFYTDSKNDKKKKRLVLSSKLTFIASDISEISKKLSRVWENICKKHIKGE